MLTSSNNLVIPKLISKLVGENAKFVCNTAANMKWAFNSGLLPKNSVVLEKERNTLIISKLSLENRGFYQCFKDMEEKEIFGIAMLEVISKCS